MDDKLKRRYIAAKRKLFERAFSGLNSKQAEAVFTTEGPLLVLAGAGSGKTTVLVRRIAFIVKYGNAYFDETVPEDMPEFFVSQLEELAADTGIAKDALDGYLEMFKSSPAKPWEILAITFTNKAANEMKERLSAILGESALEIWAGTFHSICVRILRRYIDRIGYENSFTIYDTDDSKKLISSCVKELGLDEKLLPAKKVLSAISRSKDKLIGYEAFAENLPEKAQPTDKAVAKIYEMYEKKKAAANCSSLVVGVVSALRFVLEVGGIFPTQIFFTRCAPTADMSLGFVTVENLASLRGKPRADMPQALGDILMYRTFT